MGEEFTAEKRDLVEGILYRQELDSNHPHVQKGLPFHGANPFLEELPQLKRDVLLWLKEMDRVGAMVSRAVA